MSGVKGKSGVYIRTEEHKKIIRKSGSLFQKGCSSWLKGTKGIAKLNSGSFEKGHISWCKGKTNGRKGIPLSEEHKRKVGEANKIALKGVFEGDKNPMWKGGVSFKPYPIGWTRTFKEQIRYRDRYTCQHCNIPEAECNRKLCVHHKDLNKKNLKEDNLISLCLSCHLKVHRRKI